MNVVFDSKVAQALSENFIVLDLPQQQSVDCFVVLGQDSIPLEEIPDIERLRTLHNDLVRAYVRREREFCLQAIDQLYGRFRGELDSFYDHVRQEFSADI